MSGIRLQRTGNFPSDLHFVKALCQRIQQRCQILAGKGPDIDSGLAEVWHDIDLGAALNGPDVEGQRAENLVALRREAA